MKLGVVVSQHSATYTELERIAQSQGHEVERTTYDGGSPPGADILSRIDGLVESADALILPTTLVFSDTRPEWQRRIHLRVSCGKLRVFVVASPSELEIQNRFLFFYGIRINKTLHEVGPPVTVRRSAHTFRDPSLLAGIESIELCERMSLDLCADALPVLALPEVSQIGPGGVPVVSVMAVWHALEGGAILVGGANLIADPRRLAGSDCSGIAVNDRLALNLLRFLLPTGQAVVNLPRLLSAEELISRTERNLADLVVGVLRETADDWWYECVPESIRLEAIRVHEQERGRYPKHAYLYLIQFRGIIQANFPKFEPLLKSVGWTGGKAASTSWLVALNDHRKLAAHPVKAHVANHVFSSEDMAFLNEADARVDAMLKKLTEDN